MKFFIALFLIKIIPFYLLAQLDPAAISTLSKLSPDQRRQLVGQLNPSSSGSIQKPPTANMPNRNVGVKAPEVESFRSRSEFLEDLNAMERVISNDINQLQAQVGAENSSEDNELLEALEESKALLRKIKELQRREIEKRAEEFGKSETDAIKPFGYDLFSSDPSTFAPGNEVPIPSDYRIGPGDLIEIQLFGQRNESYSLGISREGMIRFPGIGPIHAFEKGTSFLELKNHLKEKIQEQLGDGVQSAITLGAFRSIRIFLLGEVRKQGAYTVSALSTTINALLSCGGIKQTGSLRNIQLKRSGKIISTLDLYDLLLRGDTSADQALEPGDVIFVPVVEKQISISGAVRRPAKFEIIGGETLQDALALAGGVEGRAFLSNIRLERLGESFRPIVKNLRIPEDFAYELVSGDIISLGSVTSAITNSVSMLGNVERPGEYEWRNGLMLSDLIQSSMDLLPKTDMKYGLIRRKLDNGTVKVLSFIPMELFKKGAIEPIPLAKKDAVYFFSNKQPRTSLINGILDDLRRQSSTGNRAPIINVSGLVRFPGAYPMVDGMNLAQLLDASGGLLDAAYTFSAEVTRLSIDEVERATVKHLSIKNLSDENCTRSFKLNPYDRLHIKRVPYWSENLTVELSGEFVFPGTYQILRGETLANVIKRAGGLTDLAFPEGAMFTRKHIKKREAQQKEQFISRLENLITYENLEKSDSNKVNVEQSRVLLSRLRSTPSMGRLVIDLDSQIKNSSETKIILLDGDVLYVPEIPQEVTVSGEVQFPTSHLADSTLKIEDYIERSGGFTERSNDLEIVIVKSNGMVLRNIDRNKWFTSTKSREHVSAGDMIVVPVKIELPSRWLQNLSTSTQIMYQLAIATAAVNSF